MKKLIASLLFFGSFSLAMAPLVSATTYIGPPEIWPQPNPSCGTHTVPAAWKANPSDVHCESPWHMPSSYIPGGGAVADQVNAFKARHPGASFELVDASGNKMSSCNSFSVSLNPDGSFGGTCNSARLVVKRASAFSGVNSLVASVWSAFRSSLTGRRSPARSTAPTMRRGNATAPAMPSGDSVQGCQAYASATYVPAHEEANYCPQQDQCQSIGMRMTNLESMIWMLKNPPTPWPASEQAGIDEKIKMYEAELKEFVGSCANNPICLLSPESPMGPAGVPDDHYPFMQTCVKKPYCPTPVPDDVDVKSLKCIPYPIQYYQMMGRRS